MTNGNDECSKSLEYTQNFVIWLNYKATVKQP